MKKILVIGGAGTFGGRVLRLLAETGRYHLIIGGRDRAKAEWVRAGLGSISASVAILDRAGDIASILATEQPFIVIDAAGPFQASDRRVPEACIALGIHYIDLADGRDFVTGIGALDAAAKQAGVTVISGASSVPALSTAVVDTLARDTGPIRHIDIALSASNRATAGPQVNKAILSYVGKPIRHLAAGLWQTGFGWQKMARKSFEIAGRRPVGQRLVGLCDVPDLDLMPRRYPGIRNVIFRAGAELAVQNRILWLLSFAVRWGWLQSLLPFSDILYRLQGWFGFLGSDRSAMSVEIRSDNRQAIWTLVAEDGDGPMVPSFASVLLVEKLAAGALPTGAMPAAGLLTLADFAPLFGKFKLFTEIREGPRPPSLYAQVMGADFAHMPAIVQSLHDLPGDETVRGRGSVIRGDDLIARILARLFRFPPALQDGPVSVTFTLDEKGETWLRDFDGHRFSSDLATHRGRLAETFFPFTFVFDLPGHEAGLDMNIRGWRFLGLPLPRILAPRVTATERAVDGIFAFDVRIALPWGPLVIHYTGWLAREG